MARRNVDQKSVNITIVNRLQVHSDGVNMPAVDIRIGRLDDMPSLPDELSEAGLACLPALPQIQNSFRLSQLQKLRPR